MRLLISILASLQIAGAVSFSYHVAGDEPGAWPQILESVGFAPTAGGPAKIFVLRSGAPALPKQWVAQMEQQGSFLILEGESAMSAELGFLPQKEHIVVRGVTDLHAPGLSIVWEKPLELRRFDLPKDAVVFSTERWTGAPLMAAVRRGKGAALWIAVPPGQQGFERFPYLLQALRDLGLEPPFQSRRLWAFFDSAYRSRVDLDYFAANWRKAGIAALHVAAWHNFDPDASGDEYLRNLIAACHRHGILVYAWLELPHVSEQFWANHPEWREKTALLQDAQLDWRKLMNLQNRQAFAAVQTGVTALLDRFDWDGVNLAELYFESLEGAANPARFTPMNDDVRREFQALNGFDPLTLFRPNPPARLPEFLEYRAALARRQQSEWIDVIESVRTRKPHLDLTLTHVDDRFDNRMRDLIGADAGAVLPLLERHDFSFLIEDPATVWHLGPQRYPEIAERYEHLTERQDKLAIDINIVERYQDVYPTKQQTGAELFQLIHLAAKTFPNVALYFENSILKPDLPLLAASAARVDRAEQSGNRLTLASKFGVGVPWTGPAIVNGQLWPVRDSSTVWLPGGEQTIEPSTRDVARHVTDFNGDLKTAASRPKGVELSYRCNARAFASLDFEPTLLEIDGTKAKPEPTPSGKNWVLALPRGQHLVAIDGR